MEDSTSKEWKTVDFTLANSNSMKDFRLDDQMTFNVNGTDEFYRGAKSCGAEDSRSSRRIGSWEIDIENKKLIFDKDQSNEYISEIIALYATQLRLKGSYFYLEIRGSFEVSKMRYFYAIGFLFASISVIAQQSNLQTCTPAVLFSAGEYEVIVFNNLYTQNKARDKDGDGFKLPETQSFFNSQIQYKRGFEKLKKLNVGIEVNVTSARYRSAYENGVADFF
ncbi:hypothetical protein N8371_02175 [Vicingaceae bacterium]|nr:hypothetical protein [Vicingaceae bacterium]MDC1451211.1 hypothetical protein [Vicingaceae bacterium]